MIEKELSSTTQSNRPKGINTYTKMRIYRVIRTLLVGFIAASILNGSFLYIFYTPKAHYINLDNFEYVAKYELLKSRIDAAEKRLREVAVRDNIVYRSLFGLDTIPSLTTTPYPSSMYEELMGDPYSPLLVSTWEKMDILAKNLYHQSLSLDELQISAKNKEALSAAIPAVWPIDRTELKYIGAFGMRVHPIYKRKIMHKGIDLSCDKGIPVYATADAVVQTTQQGFRSKGYGQMILLKHDFGYQTRYAHLSKRLVSVGDTVRRGDVIGLTGSTGGSTGPHLHYEVIVRGEVVNPINFFNRNMSKEEYQRLMEQVRETKLEKFDE